jgi:hypothetical protein
MALICAPLRLLIPLHQMKMKYLSHRQLFLQSITDFLLDLAVPSQATQAGPQEATAGPAPSNPLGPSVAMETNSTSPESAPQAISTAKKGLTLTSVLKEANKANAAALGAIPKSTHKPRQPLSAASAPLHMQIQ